MNPISAAEFASLAGGELVSICPDARISGFALDSNDVQPGDLFIAIKGARVDGAAFAPQAIKRGAVCVLTEKSLEAPHILVPSLTASLAEYGATLRKRFAGPVVGITGSNGKTACKEFCASALSPLGPVLKSPGNRNTEYTSPLVWASLTQKTRVAVIEMAMRGPGQIAHLARIHRPTVAIVTMIGTAHIEMVASREGIAQAKSEIFSSGPETAILWQEDDFLGSLRTSASGRVRTFGFSPDADCQILGYRPLSWERCVVRGRLDGSAWEADLPTVGRHQALNAAAAILTASVLGVDPPSAAAAMAEAKLPAMRMEVIKRNGVTIILDNYNASSDSTVAAIRTLAEVPVAGKRYAVIGEMLEMGDFSESGHRHVGRALAEAPVERAILYGGLTSHVRTEAVRAGMPSQRIEAASSLEDVEKFLDALVPGDVALIKGSRALGLEQALVHEDVVR